MGYLVRMGLVGLLTALIALSGCIDWTPWVVDQDGDIEADADSDADLPCMEAMRCFIDCGVEDGPCLGRCMGQSCPAAIMLASRLRDCSLAECYDFCSMPSDSRRLNCAEVSCIDEISDCREVTCE